MMHDLAIVIPAYRGGFLRQCLASVSAQRDRRFHCYVFDDHSPDNILAIVEEFRHSLPLTYHRFGENMGRASLAGHWNRCIRMTAGEPWIWLFSDDDLMHPHCVEAFYQEQERHGLDPHCVYRFPMEVIDADLNILGDSGEWPERLGSEDFLRLRLTFSIQSSVNEFIFSRQSFEREGFPEFPLAWCSDDAAWISFTRKGEIRSLPSGLVGWRNSAANISSDLSPLTGRKKLLGCIRFIRWLASRKQHGMGPQPEWRIQLNWLATHWLMLRPQGKGMAPAYGYSVLKRHLHPWEFRYVLQKVVRMQLKQRIVQQMS